jgi:hypothetical protein
MVELKIDKRVLYAVLALLAIGIPLAAGFMLGGAVEDTPAAVATAPIAPIEGAPPPAQAQPPIDVQPVDPAAQPLGTELPPEVAAAVPRIDLEAARAAFDAGSATFVDTRTEGEFTVGHIPGALSMPVDQVERRFAELPKDTQIILYCA